MLGTSRLSSYTWMPSCQLGLQSLHESVNVCCQKKKKKSQDYKRLPWWTHSKRKRDKTCVSLLDAIFILLFSFWLCYLCFSQETDVENSSNVTTLISRFCYLWSLASLLKVMKVFWFCFLGFIGCKSFTVLGRHARCWYWSIDDRYARIYNLLHINLITQVCS